MRYQAIASPSFARQYFSDGMQAAALARAPMLVFNRKDELQWRFVRRLTRARLQPPLHYLPSSTGFVEAAACGLGWGMAPETLVAPAVCAGRVVVPNPAAGSMCRCTGSMPPCAQARCSTSPRRCALRPAAPFVEDETMIADPASRRAHYRLRTSLPLGRHGRDRPTYKDAPREGRTGAGAGDLPANRCPRAAHQRRPALTGNRHGNARSRSPMRWRPLMQRYATSRTCRTPRACCACRRSPAKCAGCSSRRP